jgi:colicin import membrane protein
MELIEQKQFAVAAYKPFYEQLEELEKSNTAIAFDYESAKGNKEARSHVYKLRQSKAALEKTRKDEKAESLRIGKAIDTEAKEIELRIEAMITVHQVKIDEIEKREADRIEAISARIESIVLYVPMLESINSKDLQIAITDLESMPIDDSYQEFINDAAKAKDARLIKLREVLATIIDRENAAAELEKLREEAAARAQKDRDDAIVAKALAAAQEALAAQESKRAADQAKAIADAEAKAKAEREASERRELQLKLDAETAERKRIESEQKAESDKLVALKLAEDNRLKAIQDEKNRVEKERKDAEAEQAKREANKTHRATINRTALASLVAGGINESIAKECISLIAKGLVDNVTINY